MSKRFFLLLFILLLLCPVGIKAITQDEQEALWRAELAQTEADIAKWQSILDSTKANTASLQQEAAVLNAKIKQAQAFIKQRNVQIAKLDVSIKEKTKTITSLEAQIEKGRESLAQLLRKTNEIDQFSLTEVMLSDEDLSSFFSDIDSFQTIKKALADLFVQIRDTKDLTEKEKASLAKQQDQQLDQKAAMALEQKKVQADEKQKQYLIFIPPIVLVVALFSVYLCYLPNYFLFKIIFFIAAGVSIYIYGRYAFEIHNIIPKKTKIIDIIKEGTQLKEEVKIDNIQNKIKEII